MSNIEMHIETLATEIVELFEDLLDDKDIEIPCEDHTEQHERHHDGNDAKLYGTEYWDLVDAVTNILRKEFNNDSQN